MPVLERFFPAAEPGRRRRTGEEPMPFPMGSLPGYQQGTLAWDLPEMIKMVKLVWKSKGELRGAKHRGVLESEDALGGSAVEEEEIDMDSGRKLSGFLPRLIMLIEI
ncbi:hypothetical protein Q9233_013653 [Columba guinea]|nr:hypothetical protein Q9233_013653 [Columba guinea]